MSTVYIDQRVSRDELLRHWAELGRDPESPDKYELNEWGEVILSPRPTVSHQRIIAAVIKSLETNLGPEAVSEVPIVTGGRIKVRDVAWMKPDEWDNAARMQASPILRAPTVCVEVMSPGNTESEILMKTHAYLRNGATEVIVVGLDGAVRYFDTAGERADSALGITLNLPGDLFTSTP